MKYWHGIYNGLLLVALGVIFWLSKCQPEKTCPQLPPQIHTDTITLIEDSIVWKIRAINIADTVAVDSMLKVWEGQRDYLGRVINRMKAAILERDRKLFLKDSTLLIVKSELDTLRILMKSHVMVDSAKGPDFKYFFRTEAEGPILSHSYWIETNCPDTKQKIARNALGLSYGGQVTGNEIRQVVALNYDRRLFRGVWLTSQLGYLPPFENKSAVQVAAGFKFQW